MKNLRIGPALLTWLLMNLLIQSPALAQTGDWQVVENLPRRRLISVEDMHHVIHDSCRFQSVVDGQLFCEYGTHPFGPSELVFRQESIRAVRREQSGTLIGMGIGAGAGAVIGAATNPDPGIGRGGSAIIGAGLYGLVGALIGSAHGHFSHGKIIYQNPSVKSKTSQSAPADREPANDPLTDDRVIADRLIDDRLTDDRLTEYRLTEDRIAAARSPYTQLEDVSADTSAHVILAQFPGRRPGPPFSARRGYPGPAYAPMWGGRPSGRHALVGAIIGGLLGAAVAAKGNAGVRASFAISAVGAGIGAGIGLSVPSYPGPQMYRRGWRDDHYDHEEASRSNSAFRPDVSVAEAQSPGNPTQVQ
jgi:hypothetical protein